MRELGSVALFEALYRSQPVLLAIIYTWSAGVVAKGITGHVVIINA